MESSLVEPQGDQFGPDTRFLHFATTGSYRWYWVPIPDSVLPFRTEAVLDKRAHKHTGFAIPGIINLYVSSVVSKPRVMLQPFTIEDDEQMWTIIGLRENEYSMLFARDDFHLNEFLDFVPEHFLSFSLKTSWGHNSITRSFLQFYTRVRDWCAAREEARNRKAEALPDLEYLLPVQQEHVKRSIVISEEETRVVLNRSKTGAGKSTMGAALAKYHIDKYGDRLLIICPISAIEAWRVALDRVGIEEADLYTFQFLSVHQVVWPDVEGVFVIIDECHSIKNLTSNVSRLIGRLLTKKPKLLLASATICEGFAKGDVAYLLNALDLHKLGFHPEVQRTIVKGAKRLKVFKDVLALVIGAFSINAPLQSTFEQEHKLHLYKSDLSSERSIRAWYSVLAFYERKKDKDSVKLARFEALSRLLAGIPRPDCVDSSKNAILGFTQMHIENEAESAAEVIKIAKEKLQDPANYSLIIVTNFIENREAIAVALSDWPLYVFRESGDEAVYKVRGFQSGQYRVILGTYSMLKQSRDFDDQLGSRPRCMIRTPVASTISESQICGRIERATTKSKAVNIVVCAIGSVEQHIYGLNQSKRDQFLDF